MKNLENLKDNGVIRRIDEVGKIVIPINYRKNRFDEKEEVYISKRKDYVIITKNNDKELRIKETFDELGRIYIDLEIRKELNWKEGDYIFIWLIEDNVIGLRKVEGKCIFCDKKQKLNAFKDKLICDKCISKIKEL